MMAAAPTWSFEGDYFTACNCEWGCPCNFNARPSQGFCTGLGVWRIERGAFGRTKLDGTKFAVYYYFPGLIEQGNGTARAYVDSAAGPEQRKALEAIATGNAGGGIFELFAKQLTKTVLPTRVVPIHWALDGDGKGSVSVEGVGGSDSELLSYPDGTTIRPMMELPHGIEFKRGLMTNAKRWWWRDEDPLLTSQVNRYGALARVKYDQTGCVG